MNILYRTHYAHALIKAIDGAKTSVTLATMVIDAEDVMKDIFTSLHSAQQRGVQVSLYIDVFTKFQVWEGLNPIKGRRTYQRLIRQLDMLEANGTHIYWLGTIGANPYKRRFHQKISIIDSATVFFAGGINLTGRSFTKHHDYMIHAHDKKLALTLATQLERIYDEKYINDSSYIIDTQNTVLLDGGKPHQSIIYDTAIEYAKKAEEIIYVSQMAPSGRLAEALSAKPVTYYLNTPYSMSPLGGVAEFINQKRYRFPNAYAGKLYIHAKYMLFTMPRGEKIALSGSHNFSERGVNYGTKEIALLTKDESLWDSLYSYTRTELC